MKGYRYTNSAGETFNIGTRYVQEFISGGTQRWADARNSYWQFAQTDASRVRAPRRAIRTGALA